jgi:hypothetical protein
MKIIEPVKKFQWSMKRPMFLEKHDKRYKKYKKQLKKTGFCDSETWAFNTTIATFIIPRLKRFKNITPCYPGRFQKPEEWQVVLDKIIFAFEWHLKQDEAISGDECMDEWKRYNEGMQLFAEYFQALWW